MGVGADLYMYDVVVKTFTFAISSTDEFLYRLQKVVCHYSHRTRSKTVRQISHF